MARKPKNNSPRFWYCMQEVRKIAGENLTEEELTELAEKLLARARRMRDTRYGMTADEAVNAALKGMSEDILRESQLKKRTAYLQHLAVSREFGNIESNWADDPRKGLEVTLIGSNIARRGAQRSIDADQKGLASQYVNGFAADVERLGPDKYRLYSSGDLDLDIYRALDQMYRDEPDFTSLDRDARDFAQIVHKYQQALRVDKNHAGAWIKELPDYITHQSHDQFGVRNAWQKINQPGLKGKLSTRADDDMNYRAWRDFVLPRLNEEETFGEMHENLRDAWLRRVWMNIASGEHLKSGSAANGFPTRTSMAGKMSQPRILQFKDATSRFEYDQQFGIGGSLFERVLLQLFQGGHDVALMRRFGPNPEEAYARLKKAVRIATEMSVKARDAATWSRDERILDSYWAEITGEARTPGTDPFSTALRASRMVATLSKLGGAVISSLTDTGIAASELQYQGMTLSQSWKTQLDGLMQGYGARGQQRADRLQLASELGVAVDYLRSAVWSRFSADDALPGWAARLQHYFFKISLLTWHTDTLRMANAQQISHNLAINSTRRMGELDAKLQRVMKLFDVTPLEWELMRSKAVDTVEGKEYFTPKGASRITDVEILALLVNEKITPTPRRIAERRELIQSKFRSLIAARADYAVITPGPKTRTYMTGQRFGAQPGSPVSELARSLTQFKSFPAAVLEKVWGRELYGYGESGKAGTSGMGQLAQFIVYSTFLGFASMYLKAYFAGRDIKTPETAKDARNVLLAAFLQGGGAGIYGDFLFGQGQDRFGRSAFSTLLGPGFGDLEDLYRMAKGGASIPFAEDSGKAAGAWAAQTYQTALSHTPFINLFYTRMALDYMILYRLQEQINPGYLKRLEKGWDERGQTYRLPPSQNSEIENLAPGDLGALVTPAAGFSGK